MPGGQRVAPLLRLVTHRRPPTQFQAVSSRRGATEAGRSAPPAPVTRGKFTGVQRRVSRGRGAGVIEVRF